MSPSDLKMHGRDHLPRGADPIPGLITPVIAGSFPDLVAARNTLWGYWPLNDVSGNAHDEVAGRDLTATGTLVYGDPGPFPGLPELTAITWSGAADLLEYQQVGSELEDAFGEGGAWTWVGWAKRPGAGIPEAFFSFHSGLSNAIGIYVFTSQFINFYRRSTNVASSTVFPTSDWHFLAMTYDGSATGNGKLYLDGVQIATLTDTANMGVSFYRLGAQGNSPVGNYLNGSMAQVALFTEEIPAADLLVMAGSLLAGNPAEGKVPVADGNGSYSWEFPVEVEY